jgi:hypothetical protein
MNVLLRKLSVLSACCSAVVFFTGCGVSEKKLSDAEQRMETLQQNGVPDSLLTESRVLISQSRTSKKLGNGLGAKTQFDSAMIIIAKAEAGYGAATADIKPAVEVLRKSLAEKKLNFSGAILKEADSLLAVIDSKINAKNWPDAKKIAVETQGIFSSLEKDQAVAKQIKPKLTGSWSGIESFKDEGANAVEKKQFVFFADGKIDIVEERTGLTTPEFKEDWKFQSGGTYDVKADTILIFITKEKCLKQSYQHLKQKGKKKEWVKVEKPTYDSVITNGKKDRYLTFDYLKEKFKKK